MIVDQVIFTEPCPLCGDNAYLHTSETGQFSRARFWVKCDNPDCRCTTISYNDQTKALKAWNTRYRAEVVPIRLEERVATTAASSAATPSPACQAAPEPANAPS